MLAYNRSDFEARARRAAVDGWEDEGLIDGKAAAALKKEFPDPFYGPNPFIRIGLFVFGLICASAAQGLFFLLFRPGGSESSFATLLLFSGTAALAIQETLARRPKPFFRAGLEEAMAYLGTGCILAGILILIDFDHGKEAGIALIIAMGTAVAAARYADSLLAAVSLGATYFALIALGKDLGDAAVIALPIVVVGLSAAVAYASGLARSRRELGPWEHVFDLLRLIGLILAYAGGNYLVVREAGKALLHGSGDDDPPFALLFQAWTFLVPPAYLAYGLWKKDRQFLDAGLLLVAAAVGTYKYYHSVMPLEVGMIAAGTALLGVAWATLKAFRPARFGISAAASPRSGQGVLLNAEGLAMLHSSHSASPSPELPGKPPEGLDGGGGKFGGGGAQSGF